MKTTRLIAVLVAIVIALFATRAEGQQSNSNSLPALLPIGSEQTMLEWIATNQPCAVAFQLSYQDSSGNSYSVSITGTGVRFSSYAAFRQSLLTNCMALTSTLQTRTNIASTVQVFVDISYPNTGWYEGLVIYTNVGPINGITSNTFVGIKPYYEAAVVTVPGLQQFSAQVQSSPPYSFTWTPVQSSIVPVGGYPPEGTTNGIVILSQWYSTNVYDARFTIVSGGQTNTYTQAGSTLSAPTVAMSGSQVSVSMASGSDTTIQGTTNFVNWQPVTTFPWSLGVSVTNCAVDTTTQRARFFRAYSQ